MNNNRLWNASNPNQGNFTKALVVCSAGLLRSPTVAWILSNPPFNMNTRAVGSTKSFALIPVDEVLLAWADVVVFVNEETFLETKIMFDDQFQDPEFTVIVLDIPDNFSTREPKLIEIATSQLNDAFNILNKQLDSTG